VSEMSDGQEALLFFYSVFWALALSTLQKFRAFDTRGADPTRWARAGMSFVVMNVVPAAILMFELCLMRRVEEVISAVPAAALFALGVFGLPRILHAIIAIEGTKRRPRFYNDDDWHELCLLDKESDSTSDHLVPGVIYLLLTFGLGVGAWAWAARICG
jgi:hypothetical protein